jgi:hypothetical protein
MSLDNVVKIGRLALSDEKLRTELLAAVKGKTAPEAATAAAAFAKNHGFDVTSGDVVKGYNILLKLQKGGQWELSDEELAAVAGGGTKGGDAAEGVAEGAAEAVPEAIMGALSKE